MLKHIVLLKWKDGVVAADIDRVTSAFAALRDEIPQIRSYEFGADAGLYNGNYDYALLASFDSPEDLQAYAVHPAHKRFLVDVSGPLLDSFVAVQFYS